MSHGPFRWFDTHLDLACIALNGRDMTCPDLTRCGGPDLPAAVTLPTLRAGGVVACLATIFTEADGADAVGYPAGNAPAAAKRGREQLEVYEQWESQGRVWRWAGQPRPAADALGIGILIEGADPIAEPAELGWWAQKGVVAVGMAWAKSSRYAGGNTTDEPITDLGFALVKEMDRLGLVHDASHLSDVSLDQLFRATDRPVIASHSNCRALVDVDGERRQRHLTDDAIKEIARRGGMIGLNVFSPFIIPGAKRDRRATVAEWVAHVERMCDLIGDRSHVGLGSDMDGGFSAATMPQGVSTPADLRLLAEALLARGWSQGDVQGFCFGNWSRFWHARHPRCPA
ncbi:MAG: membrane dipeptidase [Planctomycetes bacterium]|nr:membrane dipeptidase [Planctomycetota bacterium]